MDGAIFLDRDGTINRDTGYTYKIADWHFLPGALAALAAFANAGWPLIIISNQSGIGRGYYSRGQLAQLEHYVDSRLRAQGIGITAWYYCPHKPEANCACRKPRPGLILQAAGDLGINPASSWMLGDKASDIAAGLNAGCRAALICPDPGLPLLPKPAPIWPSLADAARAILAM